MPGYGYGISEGLTSTKSAATRGGSAFEYTAIDNNCAMEFDGVDDYVECGKISALGGLTQATWAGWFKRGTSSGSHYLMGSWGTVGGERQFLVLQTSTALTVFMGLGTFGNQSTMFQNNSFTFTTAVWMSLIHH